MIRRSRRHRPAWPTLHSARLVRPPRRARRSASARRSSLPNGRSRLDQKEPPRTSRLAGRLRLMGRRRRALRICITPCNWITSFAQAHFALGQVLCYVQRPAEGIAEIKEAFRLSPRDPHLVDLPQRSRHRELSDWAVWRKQPRQPVHRCAHRMPPSGRRWFWLRSSGGRRRRTRHERRFGTLHRFRPGMNLAAARREFYFGDNASHDGGLRRSASPPTSQAPACPAASDTVEERRSSLRTSAALGFCRIRTENPGSRSPWRCPS